MRMGALSAILLVFLAAVGCVRRDGRNSDCKWPTEIGSHAREARHLSADAEFAEDLAIRYADVHYGLHTPYFVSGEAYAGARDRCMGALFEQIAKKHGVPLGRVTDSLGRNRSYIDLAVILPFALLYCFVALAVARTIWRHYPPVENGWIPGAMMVLFLSLVFAVGSTMLGEVWSGIAESFRIGNGHMSYRSQRLLWGRHRTEGVRRCVDRFLGGSDARRSPYAVEPFVAVRSISLIARSYVLKVTWPQCVPDQKVSWTSTTASRRSLYRTHLQIKAAGVDPSGTEGPPPGHRRIAWQKEHYR